MLLNIFYNFKDSVELITDGYTIPLMNVLSVLCNRLKMAEIACHIRKVVIFFICHIFAKLISFQATQAHFTLNF